MQGEARELLVRLPLDTQQWWQPGFVVPKSYSQTMVVRDSKPLNPSKTTSWLES